MTKQWNPRVTLKPYRTSGDYHHNFETFEELLDFLKYDYTQEELKQLSKELRNDRVKYMTDTGYGITAEIYYFDTN